MSNPDNNPRLRSLVDRLQALITAESCVRSALMIEGPGTKKRRDNLARRAQRISSAQDVSAAESHLRRYLRGMARKSNLTNAMTILKDTRRQTRVMLDELSAELGTYVPPAQIFVHGGLTPEQSEDLHRRTEEAMSDGGLDGFDERILNANIDREHDQ